MIQRDRVAHMLRAAGEKGVHTFTLRQAYIGNPSERIRELEDQGWVIRHTRERLHGTAHGTRYVKVSEPDVDDGRRVGQAPSLSPGPGSHPVAVANAETLFPVEHEPRSPYDPMSEAA